RLSLRDARGEGFTPLREDPGEMRPQGFAIRRDLQAQVPDQASQRPLFGLELSRDDIEVASNPTPRRERTIAQRRLHDFLEVVEIPLQHLARERLLGPEVVRERPLWSAGFGHNVANAGAAIAALEHDLAARVEKLFAMRLLGHRWDNTDVRIGASSDQAGGERRRS